MTNEGDQPRLRSGEGVAGRGAASRRDGHGREAVQRCTGCPPVSCMYLC